MKVICQVVSLIILQLILFDSVFGQELDFNNNISTSESLSGMSNVSSNALNPDTASSVCSGQNTFWGFLYGTNTVAEFDLTNNIITPTGNSITNCPGTSLAICNNLNGGLNSPTLYTGYSGAYYWDTANTWIQGTLYTSTICLCNAGGNNNYLYYHDQNTGAITKYDGTNYTIIYNNNMPSIADIAVDRNGNAYVVTTTTNHMADSLYIISPTGQILLHYALSFNALNAYGCFLLNNVFYIGFGIAHPIYPNTLQPVTVSGTTAVLGTPIPIPSGFNLTLDLASCNPGSLVSINSITSKQTLSVFPNPAKESFTITYLNPDKKYFALSIINNIGQVIYNSNVISNSISISTKDFSNGIYFVHIQSENISETRKVVVVR